MRFMMVCMLIVAMTVSMAACGAAEPAATTAATEAPVAAAPTEPEETKAAFVPERYEPTLPPEPTVPETEPTATTDPATEPTQPKQTVSSGNGGGGNSNSATPTAAQPVHTHNYTVSRTVGATCTEDGYTTYVCSCGSTYNDNWTSATGHSWGDWVTTAEPSYDSEGQQTRTCVTCGATDSQSIPKLEAPAVSLDYGAAGNYGDSYAASTYGCIIDYSLNSDNAGYYPASIRSVDYYINNGGQAALNADVAGEVDLTAYAVGSGFNVSCCAWESGGMVYIVVYYG